MEAPASAITCVQANVAHHRVQLTVVALCLLCGPWKHVIADAGTSTFPSSLPLTRSLRHKFLKSEHYSEGYPAQPRTQMEFSEHLPVPECPVFSGKFDLLF